MNDHSAAIVFLDALEHCFLPKKEKAALRRAAETGITPELWNELNDKLIAAIVHTHEKQKKFTGNLDEEINRFTAEYEREKSVLDRQLREDLERAESAEAKELLWKEYGARIKSLQTRLLADVKKTSKSVLHDVVLATVPMGDKE